MTLPGPVAIPVVFAVNVIVLVIAVGESQFRSWPSPPPTSGNPSADCLGVVNDAAEFAQWLSPPILARTGRVLAMALKTPEDEIDEYLAGAGRDGRGTHLLAVMSDLGLL